MFLSQILLSTTSHGHPQWMEFTQLSAEIAQFLKGSFVTVVPYLAHVMTTELFPWQLSELSFEFVIWGWKQMKRKEKKR